MLTINKPPRIENAPDYVMRYKEAWSINVYPYQLRLLDRRYTSYELGDAIIGDDNHIQTIYNLLESRGSPSMALLYLDCLDNWHNFYTIKELPECTNLGIVQRLVHFTIWEPGMLQFQF